MLFGGASSSSIFIESLREVSTSGMSLLVERMLVFEGKDEFFKVETTCMRAAFVIELHESGVRSGLLSRKASLSIITVQSEFALSLLSETPEKKIRSFSNLKGMIPKERTFLPASFAICETMGARAAPDLPARLATSIMVEYDSSFWAIELLSPNEIPRMR